MDSATGFRALSSGNSFVARCLGVHTWAVGVGVGGIVGRCVSDRLE